MPDLAPDHEAERIRTHAARADAPTLRRWIETLLADRSARIALEQRLCRHIHHLRQRLGQAAQYLDGIAGKALAAAQSPWKTLPCPRCGAPVARVSIEQGPRGVGHVQVHEHPDGTSCRETPKPPSV